MDPKALIGAMDGTQCGAPEERLATGLDCADVGVDFNQLVLVKHRRLMKVFLLSPAIQGPAASWD